MSWQSVFTLSSIAYGLDPLGAGAAKSLLLLNSAIIRLTDISDRLVAI